MKFYFSPVHDSACNVMYKILHMNKGDGSEEITCVVRHVLEENIIETVLSLLGYNQLDETEEIL